jgi:hypothetical protein
VAVRGARRLPGIQFESRAAAQGSALPRMDVPVFVGFAAAGPLGTPVPLEDARTFADVFGPDAPLAWDKERSAPQRSLLGPAVRAFFRNGGTRCWVVRVARQSPPPDEPDDHARANRFPVPGLARLSPSGALSPVFLAARSEGSWSDDLSVSAAVELQPLSARASVEEGELALRLDAPDAVLPGDLLRLTWSRGSPLSVAGSLLWTVESLDGDQVLPGPAQLWLEASPPPAGPWSASAFPAGESPQPLPPLASPPEFSADGTASLLLAGQAALAPGDSVVLTSGAAQVWVSITDVQPPAFAGAAARTALTGRWSRPQAAGPAPEQLTALATRLTVERVRLELRALEGAGYQARLGDLGLAPGHPRYLGALPSDMRLFEAGAPLLEPDEEALLARVRALAGDGVGLREHHAGLQRSVANPRFPLAADQGRADLFVPIGLGPLPGPGLAAVPIPGDALARDGLGTFDAGLFLDPELASSTTAELLAQADAIRWQRRSPRRLRGIHAALAVEEATLVAVPDAAQRGWSRELLLPETPLPTPRLRATADAAGRWRLDWSDLGPGVTYALEAASTAAFASPQTVALTASTSWMAPTDLADGTWLRVRGYRRLPDAGYFSLSSGGAEGSFWSDPISVQVPPRPFAECGDSSLGAPVLLLAAAPDASGSYRLGWTAVPQALGYQVEESAQFDFSGAARVYAGPALSCALYGRAPGRLHYRVRALGRLGSLGPAVFVGGAVQIDLSQVATPAHVLVAAPAGSSVEELVFDGSAFTAPYAGSSRSLLGDGFRYLLRRASGWTGTPTLRAWDPSAAGPFSDGLTVVVPQPARRVLAALPGPGAGPAQVLLAVQAALLRLCAARGDLLAVLALPCHYREEDAVRHPTALRALLPEETPWGHGALYHPWVLVDADTGLLRAPPEGAICGVMARRATRRGSWIAPANEALDDVLGLSPLLQRGAWGRLLDAGVNVLWQEPQGFVVLSADTLAQDPELVPVGVRRLLMLLRRAALQLGSTFVFEPGNDVLRRAVERQFGELLEDLRLRGAFAGASAGDSYQVEVDGLSDGPLEGRLTVALKVAPSQALEFLTVRLVQSGARIQISEGG